MTRCYAAFSLAGVDSQSSRPATACTACGPGSGTDPAVVAGLSPQRWGCLLVPGSSLGRSFDLDAVQTEAGRQDSFGGEMRRLELLSSWEA